LKCMSHFKLTSKIIFYIVRASPVALHMHLHMRFFIRDADAYARSKHSGPR
jgi:hypothetical protein